MGRERVNENIVHIKIKKAIFIKLYLLHPTQLTLRFILIL